MRSLRDDLQMLRGTAEAATTKVDLFPVIVVVFAQGHQKPPPEITQRSLLATLR
jgi:hypothetical protein